MIRPSYRRIPVFRGLCGMAVCLTLLFWPSARADVVLSPLFSDNLVLQRSNKTSIWGKAAPDETVTVRLAGLTASAESDTAGVWKVELDLSKQTEGPFDLKVHGKNEVTIKNVMIGEVWLAAGQSNMEKPVGPNPPQCPCLNWEQEVAHSENPKIRIFTVTSSPSEIPFTECGGAWEVVSPATTAHLTAVGYFFARELNRRLNLPVGIICAAQGGASAESFVSAKGLSMDPELKKRRDYQIDLATKVPAAYRAELKKWEEINHRVDSGPMKAEAIFAAVKVDTTGWKPCILPGPWSKAELPDSGVLWFRKEVNLPEPMRGKPLHLYLGQISAYAYYYVNGVKVGSTLIPEADIHPEGGAWAGACGISEKGDTIVIAVRVVCQLGGGRFIGNEPMLIKEIGTTNTIPLAGEWLAKVETEFPPIDPAAAQARPVCPPDIGCYGTATFRFNGLIHPLIPYRLAGVLWYQGESGVTWYPGQPDNGVGAQYRSVFAALINDWRSQWGQGDFSFCYCQLANIYDPPTQPEKNGWMNLREAQFQALKIPNTGMAILIDLGDAGDVHARNKQEVGRRLALIALAKTYGTAVEYSGPLYHSMTIEENRIRLRFTHTEGGLKANAIPLTYEVDGNHAPKPLVRNTPQSQLEGFSICGEDRKWVWAEAAIEGDTVVVFSSQIAKPIAARYAWANNPIHNLSNRSGLPAAPFRTDEF